MIILYIIRTKFVVDSIIVGYTCTHTHTHTHKDDCKLSVRFHSAYLYQRDLTILAFLDVQ